MTEHTSDAFNNCNDILPMNRSRVLFGLFITTLWLNKIRIIHANALCPSAFQYLSYEKDIITLPSSFGILATTYNIKDRIHTTHIVLDSMFEERMNRAAYAERSEVQTLYYIARALSLHSTKLMLYELYKYNSYRLKTA
eukprot:443211_1